MLFQLAWRSLWRVPRRTAIIFAAVGLGVWAMVVVGSIMAGMLRQMAERDIRLLTGHLQIHRAGYFDDPVVDQSMDKPDEVVPAVSLLADAKWAPRVRVPALIANARNSSEVTLVGVDPQMEPGVSSIKDSVVEGSYLSGSHPHAIVVGERLARKFDLRVGDTVVLTSEDAEDGISARGFEVGGVFRTERKDVEDAFVFVVLPAAQSMLKIQSRISEVAVVFTDTNQAVHARTMLRQGLGAEYEVLDWKEAQPLLDAQLTLYQSFTWVWYLAVGIGIAFGVANTMLMAIHDRFREFGIVKALGMKPRLIVSQVMIESACLLLAAMAAGSALSGPTVLWLARTGIDLTPLAHGAAEWGMPRVVFPVFSGTDLLVPNCGVAVLGMLVSLYPAWKGSRILPVAALSQR